MANGYAKEIQNRIGAAPDGTIFIVSDFADVADSETIRRNLNRLVQAGTLRRILKGVFEKRNTASSLGNMWRRTRMRLPKHWRDAIIGPSLPVEIPH